MSAFEKMFMGAAASLIVAWVGIILLGIAGWVSNVVQLIHLAQADNIHAMFWVKCVGCLVAPLGSILGIVGWF